MPGVEHINGWVLTGVGSVILSLAAAVSTLFKMNESKSLAAIKNLETRLDESDRKHEECLEDRIKLAEEIAVLKERIARVADTT